MGHGTVFLWRPNLIPRIARPEAHPHGGAEV
jgi:hypothetical protein